MAALFSSVRERGVGLCIINAGRVKRQNVEIVYRQDRILGVTAEAAGMSHVKTASQQSRIPSQN